MCLPGNHQPPSSTPPHPSNSPSSPADTWQLGLNRGRCSYADLFSIRVGQGGSFVVFTVLNHSISGSLVELFHQLPKWLFYTSPQTSGASLLFIFSWWPCFLYIKNESNQEKTLRVSSHLYPVCMHFLFAMIITSSLALGPVHFLSGPVHCLGIHPVLLPAGELSH